MIPVDEKHIIKKLKSGDNEAYKYLYDYHYTALCKLSYYILKDRVQAESIVDDVFFHLWEIREKLELVPLLKEELESKIKESIDKLPTPVAVRYCFRNYAKGTLYSRYGIPVSSFRTDNWEVKE